MQLPLVALELTRGSRQRSTFALRAAPAGVCAAWLLFAQPSFVGPAISFEEIANGLGSRISRLAIMFQVFLIFYAAPPITSPSIVREKQEETLPLLLITGARHGDVLLSRLVAAFVQVEMLIAGCLPLQAIGAVLGGVSLSGILLRFALSTTFCAVCCSTGILASALARTATGTLAWGIGYEAAWVSAAVVIDETWGFGPSGALPPINPISALYLTVEGPSTGAYYFVASPLVAAAIGLTAFAVGWVQFSRFGRGESIGGTGAGIARRSGSRFSRLLDLTGALRLPPIGKLYAASAIRPTPRHVRTVEFVLGTGLLGLACTPGLAVALRPLLMAIVPVFIIYDVTNAVWQMRRSGAMELICLAADTEFGLPQSVFRVHLRRALFWFSIWYFNGLAFWVSIGTRAFPRPEILPEHATMLILMAAVSLISSGVMIACWVALGMFASTLNFNSPLKQTAAMTAGHVGALLALSCLISAGGPIVSALNKSSDTSDIFGAHQLSNWIGAVFFGWLAYVAYGMSAGVSRESRVWPGLDNR